jgi:hypothetical protein
MVLTGSLAWFAFHELEDASRAISSLLANQAAAFERISRSELELAVFPAYRLSSWRFSLVKPFLPGKGLPASIAACASQLELVCVEQPTRAKAPPAFADARKLNDLLSELRRMRRPGFGT